MRSRSTAEQTGKVPRRLADVTCDPGAPSTSLSRQTTPLVSTRVKTLNASTSIGTSGLKGRRTGGKPKASKSLQLSSSATAGEAGDDEECVSVRKRRATLYAIVSSDEAE